MVLSYVLVLSFVITNGVEFCNGVELYNGVELSGIKHVWCRKCMVLSLYGVEFEMWRKNRGVE